MKCEKVGYNILLKDVIEDGKGTVYDTVEVPKTVSKATPKPTPLIGGTEVYRKEGLPYWNCKIKHGRDEFMHLYFGDLTVYDLLYCADGKKCNFITKKQKNFRANVMKALENMPEEGFRWIPVYEPSKVVIDKPKYVADAYVMSGLNCYEWEEAFKNYSPKNGSRMSFRTTYFLLLLRLLKDGFATIEQLADDSKEIGHYWDSFNSKHYFEKTGERQLGGLYGLGGNTYKIVKDPEARSGFSYVGGSYCIDGNVDPVASINHVKYPRKMDSGSVGWLELTK